MEGLGLSVFLLGLISSATAEHALFRFSAPATSLSSALQDWSKKTKLNFLTSANTLTDKTAPPINGTMNSLEALRILLTNTQLTFVQKDDGTILIIPTRSRQIDSEAQGLKDEIIVTGIRASLMQAIAIKRTSVGVVDAITALDMAKFPDTNLAESLQRISGVSIDRTNNEGNKVTVRGLGPDFNLVTLNGRPMPVTAIPEISSLNSLAPATRSFEFVNVSTEAVSAIEVYKTPQAINMPGGIGATINIKTQRPLSHPKSLFSLGAKAVTDSTHSDTSSPELSTTFNRTFLSNRVGIFFSGAYQKRRSTIEESLIDGWVDKNTAFSEWYSRNNYEVSNLIIEDNNQHSDGNSWAPVSQHFSKTDIDRKRLNAQFTLQYAPTTNITHTLDVNLQEFKASPNTIEFGTDYFGLARDRLFGQDLTSSIDSNGTTFNLQKDNAVYQYSVSDERLSNKVLSWGLNSQVQMGDALTWSLDLHRAHAKSERFINNLQVLELGADRMEFHGQYEVPQMSIELNNPFTPKNLPTLTEPTPYTTFQQSMKNDVSQERILGEWSNLNQGWLDTVKFGLERTKTQNRAGVHEDVFVTHWDLDFNILPETNTPDDFFEQTPVSDLLKEFPGVSDNLKYIYTSDFEPGLARTMKLSEGDDFECYCTEPLAQHNVSETSRSIFIQANASTSIKQLPLVLQAGLRYESSKVSVASLMSTPVSLDWFDPTYTQIKYSEQRSFQNSTGGHSMLLPNLRFRLNIQEELIARASLSKSLARSDLMRMRNQTTILSALSSTRSAKRGNPDLKPYSSNNADLSLEWYYSDGSYMSIGYFEKHISNFISEESSTSPLFGLSDVYRGERAETARAELIAEGIPTTNSNVLERVIANNGGDINLNSDGVAVVSSNETDPLIQWNLHYPSNGVRARISGWEFSLQHLFAQSGWGGSFNYTLINTNNNYEPRGSGPQFAIPGVSDTLNLMGFYEKDKVKIRLAYNWRGQFLSALSTYTGEHPQFTEAYEQWDVSMSYAASKNLTLVLDGINLTGQNQRVFSRYQEQLISAKQFGSIYSLGLNYRFQ